MTGCTAQVGGAGERADDDRVHAASPEGDGWADGGGANGAGGGEGLEGAGGGVLRLCGRERSVRAGGGERGGAGEHARGEGVGAEGRLRQGHRRQRRPTRKPRGQITSPLIKLIAIMFPYTYLNKRRQLHFSLQ